MLNLSFGVFWDFFLAGWDFFVFLHFGVVSADGYILLYCNVLTRTRGMKQGSGRAENGTEKQRKNANKTPGDGRHTDTENPLRGGGQEDNYD